MEFTGDESGTLSKQFDPIDLDFQIDSKVVNDMKGTLLHEGIVTENEFQMSKLSFDGPRFNIFFAVINLDGDAELPVQCNIQNYTSSGDAEFELIYGPTDNEIFDHEFSDDLPVDDVVPTQSETMTFSQYAAELKQQLSSKWNGKFPYYYEKYVNGESAYFLDGNASNEFLAVIGTYIEKRFPGMYGLPSSIDTFRFLMSSVLQNAIKEVAFSGDISLTLGTF